MLLEQLQLCRLVCRLCWFTNGDGYGYGYGYREECEAAHRLRPDIFFFSVFGINLLIKIHLGGGSQSRPVT